MEITAFAARRKVLFNALTIDNFIEDIFTALYTGFPAQLVNSCCIFAEDICKKKFYLVDSVVNIETIITSTVLFGRLSGADFRCRQATGCAPLVRHAEREDTW